MEFFEVVKKRQSIRKFQETPVEQNKLTRILEAVNRAPSAGNLQAYRIIIVADVDLRARLAAATGNQDSVEQAPVVLVFCAYPARSSARYGTRGAELFCVQDATVACAYAQLAATALGLASAWLGAVVEAETIREVLRLTDDLWPIALLPLGYPAEQPTPTPRRALSDLVREV